jgi:methyltransferase family protein
VAGGKRLARAARRRFGRRFLAPLANRLGFDLLEKHYYSPVPDLASIPNGAWDGPSALAGLRFDPRLQLEFLERELSPYLGEFAPPRASNGKPGEFYLDNNTYESVDAETLYAMVRRHKPSRVVELGSGSSSLVIAEALSRNVRESKPCRYEIFDPYPNADLEVPLARVATTTPLRATEVPISSFEQLGAGDVLFVDTTHTVKTGSDVNYIVLDALPALRAGVLVHFHDVFLPWEYPRRWVEGGRYWAEQYLLQAFLAFNDSWEVVFAAQAVARAFPDELGRLIPSFRAGVSPGALWLRRSSSEKTAIPRQRR